MANSTCMPLWPEQAPWSEQSPGQNPALRLFPTENKNGCVLVCPGGGYTHLADHEGAPIAEALNGLGLSAAVLTYRLKPCYHGAPLADAKRAIRTLRELGWHKVAILGFSAGGNLCVNAAVHHDAGRPDAADPVERHSSRPDAFVSCYSVVTMGWWTHEGSRDALLGEQASDPELIRFYSGELNVDEQTPPGFIWHTAEDGFVPPQNSLVLAEAMAAHRIPFTLHIYPHGHHGIGLGSAYPEAAVWLRDAALWLLTQGFGQTEGR